MFKFEINFQDYHVFGLAAASIIISIVAAVAAYNIISVITSVH